MEEKKQKNKAKEEKTSEQVNVEDGEKEQLLKELSEAKKTAEEYKDKWMRNVAEFDNYKKRNAKIWQDAFAEGKTEAVIKILPIGDNLDSALSMVDEKTAEGLKMLKRKFDDLLKSMEIEEINPVGEIFDPQVAEAIMQAEKEDGEESDTVKQVFQKGYKIKDKIIRYAKVSVIK